MLMISSEGKRKEELNLIFYEAIKSTQSFPYNFIRIETLRTFALEIET